MEKKITVTALIFGFVSIILGALNAHTFKKFLNPEQISTFEVGVRYMFYHTFFLLFLGSTQFIHPKKKKSIYYLTVIGTLFFSVSIFLLSTSSVTGIDFKFIGPMTPIGGLFLLTSWGLALYCIITKKE